MGQLLELIFYFICKGFGQIFADPLVGIGSIILFVICALIYAFLKEKNK